MFVLDTNVLSALMTTPPVSPVVSWIAGIPIELLCTAAVCQAEILAGLAVMPEGRRRHALEAAAHAVFHDGFGRRVLSFDAAAAGVYAEIFADRRRAGRPIGSLDLMIAATARSHGAAVVTRDAVGFEGCGVDVVDPWSHR